MSDATPTNDWLPNALNRGDYDSVDLLEAAAYAVFQNDWGSSPVFRDGHIRVHRRPHVANCSRWQTYWHCVTEGQPETERKHPVPDRLERIPWARPVVEHEAETAVKVWSNTRRRDRHVCIWLEKQNYLVVLKIAYDHYVLKTTYSPKSRRRQQLHRDYAAWKKTGRAL